MFITDGDLGEIYNVVERISQKAVDGSNGEAEEAISLPDRNGSHRGQF